MKAAAFILAFLLLWPAAAQASDIGIAMYGKPKYAAGFDYLDYVNPAAPKGGDLKLAATGSFNNVNGFVFTGNNAQGLENLNLNDTLMKRAFDEPFTMYGLVAESVDVAPDRSWITFHLRKDARFHDGVPMTAEDVKYSFDMYRQFGHPVRRRIYGFISKVDILSDHDIKFTFGPGYDHESVMILAMMQVLPKHYWEKHDIKKTTLEPPLGSGPYKIRSVDPGRKVVYERVKDYWGRDLPVNKGQFNFDTVSYTYFRDDDIALQAFKSGYYDLRRELDMAKWVTRYDFVDAAKGRIVKEEIPFGRPDTLKAMVFNTRRPVFADARVREALSYMFNADWLNNTIYFGRMKRGDSIFPNSKLAASGKATGEELRILEQYKKDLPPEVFGETQAPPGGSNRDDKRKAIQLLKDAGWHYQDEKLVDAKGEQMDFEILLNEVPDEKMALEFSRALHSIGINVRVRLVDSAQFVARANTYDFDVVVSKWSNSLSPGSEQVNFWGINSARSKGGRNYAGIDNAAIDAIATSIGQSDSSETLAARARALDRALMAGHYMIPLFYIGRDLIAYTSDIQRPSVTPTYGVVLESWWQDQANKEQ